MQNHINTNETAILNYSTLETEVSAWIAQHVESMREDHGNHAADEAAKELEGNPWKALKWFVEDHAPRTILGHWAGLGPDPVTE